MDSYALKQQLVGELKETLRIKKLNLELMDSLESTTIFLLQESEKLGIELPNAKILRELLQYIQEIYNEIYPSTDSLQSKNQSQNGQNQGEYA